MQTALELTTPSLRRGAGVVSWQVGSWSRCSWAVQVDDCEPSSTPSLHCSAQHTNHTVSPRRLTRQTSVTATDAFVLHPLLGDCGHFTEQTNLFPGVRTQTWTRMFSVDDEMCLLSAEVSDLSVACSILAVKQQKKSPLPINRRVRRITSVLVHIIYLN